MGDNNGLVFSYIFSGTGEGTHAGWEQIKKWGPCAMASPSEFLVMASNRLVDRMGDVVAGIAFIELWIFKRSKWI